MVGVRRGTVGEEGFGAGRGFIVDVSDIGAVSVGDGGRALDVVSARVGMKSTFLLFNVIHSMAQHFD